jgi:chromosome segregation ATPase
MGTLDELLEYTVKARRKAFVQTQQKLSTLNENIIRIDDEMSEDTLRAHHKSLALKEAELEAHEKTKPKDVAKPTAEVQDPAAVAKAAQIQAKQTELAGIHTQITEAKRERADCVAQDARLKRISEHVANIEESYNTFVEENTQEFEDANLEIAEIVALTINRQPLTDADTTNTTHMRGLNELLDGVPASDGEPAVKGLVARETECVEQITALQDGLNAPEKAYQAYLAELAIWETRKATIIGADDKPDTIAYIKERIKRAKEFLPEQLEKHKDDRRDLVRDLHAELVGIRDAYEELYKPVQRIASNTVFSTESLQLEFNA